MFWSPILIFCSLKVPVIGIMGSGGGFRAACGLSGVMIALEESGIFDCSTYLTGLSGSSWYVDKSLVQTVLDNWAVLRVYGVGGGLVMDKRRCLTPNPLTPVVKSLFS